MTYPIDTAREFADSLGFPVLTADVPAISAAVHRHYALGHRDAMPHARDLVLEEREACAAHVQSCNTAITDHLAAELRARGSRPGRGSAT